MHAVHRAALKGIGSSSADSFKTKVEQQFLSMSVQQSVRQQLNNHYSDQSKCLLIVFNEKGLRLHGAPSVMAVRRRTCAARVVKLTFFRFLPERPLMGQIEIDGFILR
ncbi:hypothetical protein [Neorhizobium alkalisoli]|uniref:hypothetical protein n=1 Tax=Neorhizobium alkalisoli TaxID=528178 RepID=UPI0011A972D4|nr:hypothetical protein [Neorhizobium alkalisoli]